VDTITRAFGGLLLAGAAAHAAFAQTGGAGTAPGFPAAEVAASAAAAVPDDLRRELSAFDADSRRALEQFYAARDYRPYWTDKNGRRLTVLRAEIAQASGHGLPAARYRIAGQKAAAASDAEAQWRAEAAAMRSFLRYAGDLSSGIVTPRDVDLEIDVTPDGMSPRDLLVFLQTRPVKAVLEHAAPDDPQYRALLEEKARLASLLDSDPWGAQVPDGRTLHAGDRDARVVVLRDRLARLGYAPDDLGGTGSAGVPGAGATQATADTFEASLAGSLKDFQRDFGLVDDGVAGHETLRALNATVEDRLRQVVVNLERLRWSDEKLTGRRIEVNIPDYAVRMFDDGQVVWSSRAIVGERSKTRTPEFSEKMTYLVVNPTWHIPDSIATRVYLPKLRADPTVLERSDMSLFTRSGQQINPKLVNFQQYTPENFPFRVKQNPNADNALGRVKFMFPNQFAIYLHDTPNRSLFAKDARAFSNGCIRLQKPLELAYMLLDGQYPDPAATFDAWLSAGSEKHVTLERPIDVHILYRTAWQGDDGEIRYRSDVYGRDVEVFEAMKAQGVSLGDGAQG
jgi:L,D-transpeptidase YcbB